MKVTPPSLFIVLKQFPEQKGVIKKLFRENENFQGVCEDYRECAKALRYWDQSESEEAPERREEYRKFLRDLEAEILECLNESEGKGRL